MSFDPCSHLLLLTWAEAQLSWGTSMNIRFLQKRHPSSGFNTPSVLDLPPFFLPETESIVDWRSPDWAKSIKGVPKNEKQEGVDRYFPWENHLRKETSNLVTALEDEETTVLKQKASCELSALWNRQGVFNKSKTFVMRIWYNQKKFFFLIWGLTQTLRVKGPSLQLLPIVPGSMMWATKWDPSSTFLSTYREKDDWKENGEEIGKERNNNKCKWDFKSWEVSLRLIIQTFIPTLFLHSLKQSPRVTSCW